MEFPNFTMSIVNEGEDLLENNEITFHRLTIKRDLNKIPVFTLIMEAIDRSIFESVQNLDVTLVYEDRSHQFKLGKLAVIPKNVVTMKFLGCTYEQITEKGSEFLGNDLRSALLSLGIRNQLVNVEGLAGEFFRFNENRLQAFYRIMQGAGEKIFYTVSPTEIKVLNRKDFSEVFEKVFKLEQEIQKGKEFFEDKDKTYTSGNFGSVVTRENEFLFFKENGDIISNLAKNKDTTFENYVIARNIGVFEGDIGSRITNINDTDKREYQLLGTITEFSHASEPKQKLLLGGVK